jgi:hypothetical protein
MQDAGEAIESFGKWKGIGGGRFFVPEFLDDRLERIAADVRFGEEVATFAIDACIVDGGDTWMVELADALKLA